MKDLLQSPRPIVLSPGPKGPEDVLPTLHLTSSLLGKVPILGICLGHQILAHLHGARIVKGADPHHGNTRLIIPRDGFQSFAVRRPAAFYNSLVVDEASVKGPLRVISRCDHGEVAGIINDSNPLAPAVGLQFHPESYLSQGAQKIRDSFVEVLKAWYGNGTTGSRLSNGAFVNSLVDHQSNLAR